MLFMSSILDLNEVRKHCFSFEERNFKFPYKILCSDLFSYWKETLLDNQLCRFCELKYRLYIFILLYLLFPCHQIHGCDVTRSLTSRTRRRTESHVTSHVAWRWRVGFFAIGVSVRCAYSVHMAYTIQPRGRAGTAAAS